MYRNPQKVSVTGAIVDLLALFHGLVLQQAWVSSDRWYALLPVSIPLLLVALILSRKNRIASKQRFNISKPKAFRS